MSGETVVLRLVGAARLAACAGGYGPVVAMPEAAADALLAGRPVRLAGDDEQAVRSILAARALAGDGPDGRGVIWQAKPVPARIAGTIPQPPIVVELTNREW